MGITCVQSTTICVSDQDKAIDFYVNKLGFELREDQPFGRDKNLRWIEVAPPDSRTAIVLAKGYGGCTPDRIGRFTGIVLETHSVLATYDLLTSRGVVFTQEPVLQPWGIMEAQFLDQDGNRLVLIGGISRRHAPADQRA